MRRLLALSVALVLSGCFQSATVMTVRPDGSATIRDEITLSGMALLAAASEGEDGGPLFDGSEAETRLATLGEGATLESFEAREDGYTAVYAIGDVRTVTLGPPAGGAADATDGLAVTFGFEEGDPSVLRVVVPKPERGKPSPPSDDDDEADDEDAEALRMLGMMRSMFSEARLTVAVEIEGEVVDTTAPTLDGGRLTVFDFSFDALLDAIEENPDLAAASADPMAQYDRMREIEGVEMLRPGTVRVRFR